jgi:hypothetical protein
MSWIAYSFEVASRPKPPFITALEQEPTFIFPAILRQLSFLARTSNVSLAMATINRNQPSNETAKHC